MDDLFNRPVYKFIEFGNFRQKYFVQGVIEEQHGVHEHRTE